MALRFSANTEKAPGYIPARLLFFIISRMALCLWLRRSWLHAHAAA